MLVKTVLKKDSPKPYLSSTVPFIYLLSLLLLLRLFPTNFSPLSSFIWLLFIALSLLVIIHDFVVSPCVFHFLPKTNGSF